MRRSLLRGGAGETGYRCEPRCPHGLRHSPGSHSCTSGQRHTRDLRHIHGHSPYVDMDLRADTETYLDMLIHPHRITQAKTHLQVQLSTCAQPGSGTAPGMDSIGTVTHIGMAVPLDTALPQTSTHPDTAQPLAATPTQMQAQPNTGTPTT